MAEQNEKIDFSAARHTPANFCHLRHTNEEFIIDFGMTGADNSSPKAVIDTSMVLSPYTAKRLLHSLAQLIGNYEQHFGEIQINFEDRLVAQRPVPMQQAPFQQGPPPPTGPIPLQPQQPQAPPQAPPPTAPMHVPVPPGAVQNLGQKPTESINRPPRGFLPKMPAMINTDPTKIPDVVIDVPEGGVPVQQMPPAPQQAPPPNNSPCNPAEEP